MEKWGLVVASLLVATMTSMVYMVNATSDGPLYLTPLIEQGKTAEAKNKSRVRADWAGTVESYAGYFTVNATYNSNLFFWFFPAKNSSAPFLLWLNGGPGISSMVGALIENGPLVLTKNENGEPVVAPRQKHAWTDHFHMLYVDSPVGTGFSFTDYDSGYARLTTTDVAPNLYNLLIQFYNMFTEYRSNPFFAGGQSYAGKYVPVLAKYIHDQNQGSPAITLPLKGIYVGSGLCNPEVMFPELARSLYYAGMISSKSRRKMVAFVKNFTEKSIQNKKVDLMDVLHFLGYYLDIGDGDNGHLFNLKDRFKYDSYHVDIGDGGIGHLLGLKHTAKSLWKQLNTFMNRTATKRALHVTGRTYKADNFQVKLILWLKDLFTNTSLENGFLMENYKVLHYSASFDFTVSVAMTEAFLKTVQWNGRSDYIRHKNKRWWSADYRLLGWSAQIRNLTRVIVRNAGHDAPFNKPEATLEMMTNFVFGRPFKEVQLLDISA